MLKKFRGDLHIHTCLSPCGENNMTAKNIIEIAKNKGLNLIGISDHNSVENVESLKRIGNKYGIKVLGGIEITSSEEVHILGFFDRDVELLKIQEIVYENLEGENDEELFGKQIIINEDDEFIGINKKLLIGATKLKLNKIVDTVHNLGGIAIAAHIDRSAFSIISQLGFIPKNLELDAVEVQEKSHISHFTSYILPGVSFSDAHRLDEIGKNFTTFLIEDVNVKEIKKALLNCDGRKIVKWKTYPCIS